jgi:hypothetical protein
LIIDAGELVANWSLVLNLTPAKQEARSSHDERIEMKKTKSNAERQ